MTTPTQIIDVKSDAGKNFLKNVELLKKELRIEGKGDKIKYIKNLTSEQIIANAFLRDFMDSNPIFKSFEIRNVSIGNFGRKIGYTYKPIKDTLFRFFIHLGSPEVYYMDDEQNKDKMFPLENGFGFIVSPLTAPYTSISVYSDPVRLIHNPDVQAKIPKIRPRDYSRTTLVYDLDFIPGEGEHIHDENCNHEDVPTVHDENCNHEDVPTVQEQVPEVFIKEEDWILKAQQMSSDKEEYTWLLCALEDLHDKLLNKQLEKGFISYTTEDEFTYIFNWLEKNQLLFMGRTQDKVYFNLKNKNDL